MHRYFLTLLLVLLLPLATAHAEESAIASPETATPQQTTEQVRIGELEAELANLVRQRDELLNQQENGLAEREVAQMSHLRQENQKLKLQVREALAQQQQSPLTETQIWYLLGAATGLLGAAIGALLRGNRRRRQWIN